MMTKKSVHWFHWQVQNGRMEWKALKNLAIWQENWIQEKSWLASTTIVINIIQVTRNSHWRKRVFCGCGTNRKIYFYFEHNKVHVCICLCIHGVKYITLKKVCMCVLPTTALSPWEFNGVREKSQEKLRRTNIQRHTHNISFNLSSTTQHSIFFLSLLFWQKIVKYRAKTKARGWITATAFLPWRKRLGGSYV